LQQNGLLFLLHKRKELLALGNFPRFFHCLVPLIGFFAIV